MNRKELHKRIVRAAGKDRLRRADPRYLGTMGFLVSKGFLNVNWDLRLLPNRRVRIEDAVWAGKNVEPRILEVLPAAILRLPRHFDLDPANHPELYGTVERLRQGDVKGEPLWGIAYEKIRMWVHLPLADGRVKDMREKKITKTFRLRPAVVDKLRELAQQLSCTETEVLERSIVGKK